MSPALRIAGICDACRELTDRLARLDKRPRNVSPHCWTGLHGECESMVQLLHGCVCVCHLPTGMME